MACLSLPRPSVLMWHFARHSAEVMPVIWPSSSHPLHNLLSLAWAGALGVTGQRMVRLHLDFECYFWRYLPVMTLLILWVWWTSLIFCGLLFFPLAMLSQEGSNSGWFLNIDLDYNVANPLKAILCLNIDVFSPLSFICGWKSLLSAKEVSSALRILSSCIFPFFEIPSSPPSGLVSLC